MQESYKPSMFHNFSLLCNVLAKTSYATNK